MTTKPAFRLASSIALLTVFTSATFAASPQVQNGPPALIPWKSADAYFEKFEPKPAPQPAGLLLQKGDRLAICGDSITEQKMYSRIMETYLTVCVPQLDITVRQYGWGGETAPGFLRRMTNDCLRFDPTIATTCYGMNDHGYRAYAPEIGERYRAASTAIVRSFQAAGARVIQGSPGCVGLKGVDKNSGLRPNGWDEAGVETKNLNLCTLRNIGIEIAEQEKAGFADVFWPMLNAGFAARSRYDSDYAIAGRDGVHPDWAGQLTMAYAFLRALGLNGEIGTVTVDLKSGQATASSGHEVVAAKAGQVDLRSTRYPFCAVGEANSDRSIRSAMTLIPFNKELNRMMLKVKNGDAARYKITWGTESKSYAANELAFGVNLAHDFAANPFVDAFNKVDKAVAAKQSYETKQIKVIFHDLADGKYSIDTDTGALVRKSSTAGKAPERVTDPELKRLVQLQKADGKFDRDEVAAETERTRAPLVAAVKEAFVPVNHTITVVAE